MPTEEELQKLEEEFPLKAGEAFAKAYQQALDAGFSVLISKDGWIWEVFPDGHREKIKEIDPPVEVKPGKYIIR